MTLENLLAPTYVQMLTRLSAWIDKAIAQLPPAEAEALLSARLAPDMFPLATQVRFACVQAQEGMYRLSGQEFPASINDLLDEGRDAGSRPGTLMEAQARIHETIALVNSISVHDFADDPQRPIAHALPIGMIFDLTAEQYARDWALAQFYFHVMIAYAILRNAGLNLGKADYVSHMLAFLRPGAERSQ